jgi:hypothetical protein
LAHPAIAAVWVSGEGHGVNAAQKTHSLFFSSAAYDPHVISEGIAAP